MGKGLCKLWSNHKPLGIKGHALRKEDALGGGRTFDPDAATGVLFREPAGE